MLRYALPAVLVIASADAASAQLYLRPGFGAGAARYYGYPQVNPYQLYGYTPANLAPLYGSSLVNPYLAYGYGGYANLAYGNRGYYNGGPLFFINPGYGYGPGISNGYLYGSASGLAGSDVVGARQQLAIRKAQQAASNDPVARQQIFDQWAYEKGAKPADPDAATKNATAELKEALTNPTEEMILSGKALNELLKAVQARTAKGAKANAPFVPPELYAAINFDGGPAAEAMNLFRTETIAFPEPLMGTESDVFRGFVEKDFAQIRTQMSGGKRGADPVLLDRLAETAAKWKAKFVPTVRADADFDESAAAVGLLNRLGRVAKYLREPSALAVVGNTWNAVGVGLADLTQFMGKNKVVFGPAAAGNEPAYFALHRGLSTYLADLAAAK